MAVCNSYRRPVLSGLVTSDVDVGGGGGVLCGHAVLHLHVRKKLNRIALCVSSGSLAQVWSQNYKIGFIRRIEILIGQILFKISPSWYYVIISFISYFY